MTPDFLTITSVAQIGFALTVIALVLVYFVFRDNIVIRKKK